MSLLFSSSASLLLDKKSLVKHTCNMDFTAGKVKYYLWDSKRSKGLCTQEKKKKVKDYKTDNEMGFPSKVP